MGRVKTNSTSLSVANEVTPGVLPGTPEWELLEPNTIGVFGATVTNTPRNPISRNRQRRKGVATDLDSAMDFEADFTVSHFDRFVEGFVFASLIGEQDRDPSAVDATEYTVDSGSVINVQALVRGVNFTVAGNNGLHLVDGVPTATTISAVGTEVEAAPPASARVEIVGFEGEAGDIGITVAGSVITMTSTLLDFTDFNLQPGQFISIGGTAVSNRFFASPSLNNSGRVRVVSVAATAVVVDKATETFVTDAGAAKTIQVFFGQFVKNLPTTDGSFLERSFQFELDYPGLATNGVDSKYAYSIGNFANTMAITLPLTDKATIAFGFIGLNTTVPSETRADEAENAVNPIRTAAFSTSIDCVRLRITQVDETGLTTDFKSATITIANNVEPEKVLCTLGSKYMNFGNFDIDIEAQVLFSDSGVVDAIYNNETVTMDFGVKNEDGMIMFDIPSMTLGDGSQDFPVGASVNINVTAQAFQDSVLNSSIGVSKLPYVPTL